jgi:DNA-binding CsgD family transcriptional regulator
MDDAALSLSKRQLDLAPLLAQGLNAAHMAHRLGLSVHTIDKHIRALHSKLSCSNRAELVARLYFLKVLDADDWPPALSAISEQGRDHARREPVLSQKSDSP